MYIYELNWYSAINWGQTAFDVLFGAEKKSRSREAAQMNVCPIAAYELAQVFNEVAQVSRFSIRLFAVVVVVCFCSFTKHQIGGLSLGDSK